MRLEVGVGMSGIFSPPLKTSFEVEEDFPMPPEGSRVEMIGNRGLGDGQGATLAFSENGEVYRLEMDDSGKFYWGILE